jgi:enoyl-CoA hydratase/carnithine racemase
LLISKKVKTDLKQRLNLLECFGTEDFKEGTTAFLEKRKAVLLKIK